MAGDKAEQKSRGVTDEDIELQKLVIGLDEVNGTREFHSQLSEDAIRNFALSNGDDNPLFTDEDYARSTRWGSVIAPPIMAAVTNKPLMGKKIPKDIKKQTRGLFKGCQIFMSGGKWEWYRPMYPGDTVYSFEAEESMEVKESEFSGRVVHIFRRYVKFNQRGEVIGVYRALRILSDRKAAREKKKNAAFESASYTDEQIAEIDSKYLTEKPRGASPRYWEDVNEDDILEPIQKGPLTTTDIFLAHVAGYGFAPFRMLAGSRVAAKDRQILKGMYSKNDQGVLDTEARVHWDRDLAKRVGNPEAYDWGLQREFWLHHLLTDWAGDDGFVISQSDQIRKFNYIGDFQKLGGKVVNKYEKDANQLVDVEISAINQRGETTAIAEATIALPSKEKGPVLLPPVPLELQSKALEFLAEHNRLSHGDLSS